MRWGYLVPRIVIVAIFWAFFAFAFDPLLRRSMIGGGESLAEARVEINDVRTTFFPPSLTVEGVQIANRHDPWKNVIELDSLQLQLEGKPLLRKSIIVDEAAVTGLKWNTPRETSGALAEEERKNNPYAKLARDKAGELADNWYDDFANRMKAEVDPKQLASVQLADELKSDWTKRFAAYEKRVKDLEKQLKQIEAQAKNAKGNTFEKIESYRKAAEQANRLLAEADRIKTEMQQLPKTAEADFRRIEAARQQDQLALRKKLDIFKLDAETLTNTLLGPTLKSRMEEAVEWSRWVKDGIGKLTYKGPAPQRSRGVNIPFPRKTRLPKFLIRKLRIAGEADWQSETMPFEGTITGITSDPDIHGEPIVIQLAGKAESELVVTGTADYTTDTPSHRVRITLTTPQRKELSLGDSNKMKLAVTAEHTVWSADVTLVGDRLAGVVKLTQDPVRIVSAGQPQQPPTKTTGTTDPLDLDVQRLLESALANVRKFEATVVLSGTSREPKWALQSDLGTQVADGVNQMIARELTLKQQQLTKQLDQTVAAKSNELAKQLNSQYGAVLSQLRLQETGVQQLMQKFAGGRPALDFNGLFRR